MNLERKIMRLARTKCASYIDGACAFEPFGFRSCVYERNENKLAYRCPYFESSVLPSDPVLEQAYKQKSEGKGTRNNLGDCTKCHVIYVKRSNRQKYCDHCRDIIQRDRAREGMRTKRQDVNS